MFAISFGRAALGEYEREVPRRSGRLNRLLERARKLANGIPMSTTEFIDVRQLAEMLGLSVQTLNAWRCTAKGPPFLKFGSRVRYARDAVSTWIASRTVG